MAAGSPRLLINSGLHLHTPSPAELTENGEDPLAFRAAMAAVKTPNRPMQRGALCYLAFPKFLLSIVNPVHRRSIRDTFVSYLPRRIEPIFPVWALGAARCLPTYDAVAARSQPAPSTDSCAMRDCPAPSRRPGWKDSRRAPDLLDRDFTAEAPNRKWVTDFTYCRAWAGFVYVALVIDCVSRAIVGWHAATMKGTAMVTTALKMALWRRDHGGHAAADGLIHHSDGLTLKHAQSQRNYPIACIKPKMSCIAKSRRECSAVGGVGDRVVDQSFRVLVSGRASVQMRLMSTAHTNSAAMASPPKVARSMPARTGGVAPPTTPARLYASPAPV